MGWVTRVEQEVGLGVWWVMERIKLLVHKYFCTFLDSYLSICQTVYLVVSLVMEKKVRIFIFILFLLVHIYFIFYLILMVIILP